MLPLVKDRETEHYILLATEAKGEEWVEVLCSLVAKEGEALGELVPRDCDVDSYLPLVRKAVVEWVACTATPYTFSALTMMLVVDGLLRLGDDKPWMGRFVTMACLSLVEKVEETRSFPTKVEASERRPSCSP
ncbi:unnamed protein product, partial [Musa banksii]